MILTRQRAVGAGAAALGVLLALAGPCQAHGQGGGLEARYDAVGQVGELLLEGRSLARREGWAPEAMRRARGPGGEATLVYWWSMPRRNYLRVEAWRGGTSLGTWPGGEEAWYRARPELREFKGRDRLLVRHALVPETLEPPLLRATQVLELGGEGLVAGELVVDRPETPAQVLNLLATRAARGDWEAARGLAEALPVHPPGLRQRATEILAGAPAEVGPRSREGLLLAADGGDLGAANALLKEKLEAAHGTR